ncbi:MAG: PAS domain-containing protein [Gemmatimonadota bacterium]|nr:PAS domain-containing protein [Gemmatimonadota bacterium]
MKKKELEDIISSLEIRLNHLRNDYLLTKEEYENTSRKYFETILEMKDKNKQLLDLQKNLEDIVTQRTKQLQETQKELQQKNKELEIMLDASPAMTFYKDTKSRYLRVNKAFANVLGLHPREIVGKTDKDLFGRQGTAFIRDDLKVIRSGEPVLNKVETLDTAKGKRIIFFDKIPLRDADGEVDGIIGLASDITERRMLEEERIKASKLESIGILAGGIAHDFNNILTSILGNISLGKMTVNEEDEVFPRLTEAEKAVQRAKDLTQQLLTFSKGGAPIKKSTSIRELIMDSALFAVRGSNVRCRFHIPNDLWPVEVDEGQISQVINNLIINADHAMPDGGYIDVTAGNIADGSKDIPLLKKKKYVKITVKDRGTGIHPEHLLNIFDLYFSTKPKGSGLGLATSYSIIKKHGGHISVDSKQGQGTVFMIYLYASNRKIREKEDEHKNLPSIKGRVLLMDDEKSIRSISGKMLKHLGHEVKFAHDGGEAVRLYRKAMDSDKPFDVVIMDLTIPGNMGGKEAIRKLQEVDPDVRAIVSSGYSNDPVLSDFRKYGFRSVVSKPYNIEELKEKVCRVILEKDKVPT